MAAALAAAAAVLGTGSGLQASAPEPYVVRDDRGGYVRDRLIELRNLRASGRRVEIRGRVCYSTCTMLLGLPNTCISPTTQFGFHGPSRNGRPLPPDRFEYYSQVIAQYYPPALNRWYLSTGRKRLNGVYKISGRDIIRMGIEAC